ncbi:hypothetical protein ACJJIR_17040 [Microbulbifer sp. SSSA008]|uniref:hypothetical protein n=1 Tax=Microbulbifer sp. SSSA008 TaxID=3243380 RepID=UPI004038FB6B
MIVASGLRVAEEGCFVIRESLRVFIFGLLAWPLLSNILSFLKPFLIALNYDESSEGLAPSLIDIIYPYFTLISIAFAYAFFILTRMITGRLKRWLCVSLVVAYLGVSIYPLFPEESIVYLTLSGTHYLIELIMLIIGATIIYKNISEPSVVAGESVGAMRKA